METSSNVHAGHRERLIQKLNTASPFFNDHELLEVLLFYAIPRKDTNDLAHKLLKTFGTIDKVFDSAYSQLLQIEGVGKKTASLIICVGEIYRRIKNVKNEKVVMYTLSDVKQRVVEYYKNATVEKFALSLLDKNYVVIKTIEFCDDKRSSVGVDLKTLAEQIIIHKPSYAVLSHNHTSGNVMPSEKDTASTKKIRLICELYGVDLIDHVIVSGQKFFSYYSEGLLDQIKKETDIEKVLNTIKEI